jgi:hypothetical protein
MKTVTLEVIGFTPATARAWLAEKNLRNRRIRKHKVSKYHEMMKRGEWRDNFPESPILLDEEGQMTNGQSRLTALAMFEATEPGKVIQFRVERNRPMDERPLLDNAVGIRDLADAANIDPRVSSPIHFIARLHLNGKTSSDYEIRHYIPIFFEPLTELVKQAGRNRPGFSVAPIKAAAAIAMLRDPDPLYPLRMYRALVERDNATMTPYVDGFRDQIVSGVATGHAKYDLFSRATLAFEAKRAPQVTQPHFEDFDYQKVLRPVRTWLDKTIFPEEEKPEPPRKAKREQQGARP